MGRVKLIGRRRILARDSATACGAMENLMRCYAKLRDRAGAHSPSVADFFNKAALGLRDAIEAANEAEKVLAQLNREAIEARRSRL